MAARSVSIKTRITLTLVLLPLVSILVVGAVALFQNRDSLSAQAGSNLERILREKTTAYDHIFNRVQQEAQAAARYASLAWASPLPVSAAPRRLLMPWTGSGYGSPDLDKRLSGDTLRLRLIGQTLEALVSSNSYLTLGYFGTESGITVFDNEKVVDVIEAIKGFDPRARPWYKMAHEAGKPVWTNLYVDANTKKLTVTAAVPVKDASGAFLGVVGFDVLLETIQKDILTLDIGYSNEPFMIDSQGKVIVRRGMDEKGTAWDKTYRTDSLLETPNTAFNAIVKRMTAGESGIARYRASDRAMSYLAYAPIPAVSSSLGVVVPAIEIERPVQESGKLLIIILAAFVVASVGIGILLGNQVTRPIEELTVMMDKASKGLVEMEEIPIRRMDEVGVLARSFNRMVANLGTVLRELEHREPGKEPTDRQSSP
ncbi:MAG TPA: cache domain-containing protein [Spirochaetia bacterium]|nr:cache domain-containing protein [Spirochaetia bacterium]